ncbi:MAG: hypothetical protein WCF84_17890, partial [Anaerolineae bacterium]
MMKKIIIATTATICLFLLFLALGMVYDAFNSQTLAQGQQQSCPLTQAQAQNAAQAFQAMAPVFQSPRCLNCHGAYGDISTNPKTKHPGGYIPLDNFGNPKDPSKECTNCHDLGGKQWQIAPPHMFFTNENTVSMCQQMKRMDNGINVLNHLASDRLVQLGFQGKKGQSDQAAEPPPISKGDFLKLAENWVSAVYSSTAHSVWGQPFPGGNESSCGCDPNNFK